MTVPGSRLGEQDPKLEFLFAEAEAQGADMVMTQGATQSNHARQTAAFAAKLGLDCHILPEDRTGYNNANYNENGNVFDHLHGATTKFPGGHDMPAKWNEPLKPNEQKGARYIQFRVVDRRTGALGYVNCAFEHGTG